MGRQPWHFQMANWSRRAVISVRDHASAGPYFTLVVPQHAALWDNMQADGDDLRVQRGLYTAVGVGADFSNDAPDVSGRTIGNFIVEMINNGLPNTRFLPYWVYWGNASATNGEGSVTNTNATTYRWQVGPPNPARTVICVPDAPGATAPSQRISKLVDEECDLWWDLTPFLGDGPDFGGRPSAAYTLSYIDNHATTGSGLYSASGATREATFTDAAEILMYEDESTGRFYVGLRLLPGVGSSGTNYVAKLRGVVYPFTANVAEQIEITFEFRCLVQVQNVF